MKFPSIPKNWRTTIVGLLTAGGYAALTAMQGGVQPKDAAIIGGIAALGWLSKDAGISGTDK